jgi:glycosyltransferase involved in cell wall biosynthesis
MKAHDALVLPSIVEGRALVQQEALSCGLPIIVTPNAGGEDLVEEGFNRAPCPIRSQKKSQRPSVQ